MELSSLAKIGLVLLGIIFTYQHLIYPYFLSPLSKVPSAHPLARVTSLWINYIRYTRHELRTIHAAHQRFGPVILLSPTEVSVNCVKGGIQTIYSGGFEKKDWYDLFANYGDVRNMFSMNGSREHAGRKRMMSNIYSKSFLQASSALEGLTKEIVYGRILPRLSGFVGTGEAFDIYSELSGMTMDFVTGYQFGLSQSSNFVQDVSMRERFLDWYTSRTGLNFWPQEHPKLTAFLARIGINLVPDHVPAANENIEKWCLSLCDSATRFLQDKDAAKVENLPTDEQLNYPMVISQITTAMTKSKTNPGSNTSTQRLEIASEMLDHLAAGFDTSGITLCYVVHELSKHPSIQSQLRKELLTLTRPLQPSTSSNHQIPTAKSLDALPLLDAILQETLRLHPAIPGPQPRITPPDCPPLGPPERQYPSLPANLRISSQAYSLHRNASIFPLPESWLPSRWLEASPEQVTEMRRWFWAFGSGGRMCVGSNLAVYQMKYILASIYSGFRTVIVDDDGGLEQMDLYTAPPKGGKLVVRLEAV